MTNNKQQTAVEWLIDKHFGGIENVTPDFKKHIEEAKEMGKQQIINANEDCSTIDGEFLSGEQYYNETYGGNK